jgi:hypothetical protein
MPPITRKKRRDTEINTKQRLAKRQRFAKIVEDDYHQKNNSSLVFFLHAF